MRKIMILLLSVLGTIAVAVALDRAIEKEEESNGIRATNQTWHYNGGPTAIPTVASNYSLYDDELCGGDAQTICTIEAPESLSTPGQPNMAALVQPDDPNEPITTVAQQITDALASGSTNETVKSFREF